MQGIHEFSPATEQMSEAEQEKVRKQLNRLLETHHFKNSRRYPALLRFIVEETLEGRGEFLKERLLGVRVFDRPADYDTAADPIVRVTIAEIRKRIAQYYHDEEHDAEMRIELMPGRYAPEFRARTIRRDTASEKPLAPMTTQPRSRLELEPQATVPVIAVPAVQVKKKLRRWIWPVASVALAVALGISAYFLVRWVRPTAVDQVWAPVFASSRPVLFCVPTDVGKRRGPADDGSTLEPPPEVRTLKGNGRNGATFLDYEALGENVVYSDMLAALQVANVMALHHRDYHVRLNVATNLEDLRQGPAILIGGLDNQWTMRALKPLQFHFEGSDETRYWISDTKNPSNHDWSLDLKQQYGSVTRDYAVIARLHNDQTGQPEMILAGIGMSGTAAAGEFLADPERVEELRRRIGPGFKDHDFEVVLSTDVVNGIAGSAKILAVATW